MRITILRTLVLVATLITLLPCVAHSQESDTCEVFYCTAYGVYDVGANQLWGYVEYYDEGEDYLLKVDAYVSNPSGDQTFVGGSGGQWDDATFYVESNPGSSGVWKIIGYPSYYFAGEPVSDGAIYFSVAVNQLPSSENVSSSGPWPGGYGRDGGYFYITLSGTGSYNGQYVSEGFSGYNEDCSEKYSGPRLGDPTPGLWYVSGNTYGPDIVGITDDLVSPYRSLITTGSCSWQAIQILYIFNPSQEYWSDYVSSTLSPGINLVSHRDGIDVPSGPY